MRFLYRYSIRNPKAAIVLGCLVVGVAAPGLARLKIRTDGHALVPADAPEIQIDREIRQEFGIEDPIAVLIRADHPNGLFNPETLEHLRSLTEKLKQIPGVHPWNVISLATEKSDRVRPGTLIFRRFLEPFPCTDRQLDQLRSDLEAIELYTGTLVSDDGQAAVILVGVPESADRTEFYQAVLKVVNADTHHADSVDVIGAPVAEALLGTHILQDLGVPSWVLGSDAPSSEPTLRMPTTLFEWRVFVAGHIGLVPIALMLMVGVFLIFFRSLTAATLPLMEVGACLVFVFGMMGWVGVPVYLTVAVLPVILTAIGIADEIHIFARYREHLLASPDIDSRVALRQTMEEMFSPVLKTSITTSVGFLAFALSPIRPVQAFGIFTAVGILFCLFWSLTVIPASLAITPADWFVSSKARRQSAGRQRRGLWESLTRRLLRARFVVVLLCIAAAVALPYGIRRVVVQDSWIDGFAPESRFYKATTYCNDQFFGTHTLLVSVDCNVRAPLSGKLSVADADHKGLYLPADLVPDPQELVGSRIYMSRKTTPDGRPAGIAGARTRRPWDALIETVTTTDRGAYVTTERRSGSPQIALRQRGQGEISFRIVPEPMTRPEITRHIESLELFLATHREEAVGGVLGPASYISTTSFMARGRRADARAVPDNRNRLRWLWLQYEKVRTTERRAQAVTDNFDKGLIHVFLKNANFVATARLIESLRQYEQERLKPVGLSLSLGGDVAVSQTLIKAIVTTQVRSLLGSLLGIFLISALLGRSVTLGVLCVLPCAMAVLANFAVMGWMNIPLGVATSMFSGMTLGIGVDFAIHLLERYRSARRAGKNTEAAIVDAVAATGPAIVIDAAAVAIGFGVLVLSQVPANARLGGLLVLSIASCLVVTLLLIPVALRLVPHIGRPRGERQIATQH